MAGLVADTLAAAVLRCMNHRSLVETSSGQNRWAVGSRVAVGIPAVAGILAVGNSRVVAAGSSHRLDNHPALARQYLPGIRRLEESGWDEWSPAGQTAIRFVSLPAPERMGERDAKMLQ